MKNPAKTKASPRASGQHLALHLGLSATHIRRLVKEGIVERGPDEKFDLDASRLAYIGHLRTHRNRQAEGNNTYRRLKNHKLQIEIAKLNGTLINLEECVTLTEQLVGSFRAGLSGLPARITSDIVLRGQIGAACDEMLTQLSDDYERKSKALQDGQSLIEVEAAAEQVEEEE